VTRRPSGDGRGRDLPELSTGRHFPQPFVARGGWRAVGGAGGNGDEGECEEEDSAMHGVEVNVEARITQSAGRII